MSGAPRRGRVPRTWYNRPVTVDAEDRDDQAPLRRLLDEASDAAFLFRARRDASGAIEDFVFEYANHAAEVQLGRPRDTVLGRGLCELYPFHREQGLLQDYARVADGGGSLRREVTVPGLPPGTMWYQQQVFATAHGVGILSRDVTHEKLAARARRELERLAEQAQQLSSIGMLAGAIAHDFNNLLVAIGGFAELAQLDLGDRASVEMALSEIRAATARGAALTKRLLSFSGGQDPSRERIELDALIGDNRALLTSLLGAGVELSLDLRAPGAHVMGDETQLLQVLINLAANGRDAMDGRGRLHIATERRAVVTAADRLVPGQAEGEYVRVTVVDRGRGIPEETRQRIFEPFFTTKGVTQGTGLGLAIVFWTVRAHGGAIALESAEGQGTTFWFDLPVAKDEAVTDNRRSDDVAPRASLPEGSTVLVVDDELPVRVLVARALERGGHRALVASDGREAIDVFRQHRPDIDVVLLDAVMPGLNGYQTYLELRAIDPDVRVLFSTGYEQDVFPPGFLAEGALPLLRKPYDLPSLLSALGAALARGPASDG